MGQFYEIQLPEALTWSWYFFAMIKAITYDPLIIAYLKMIQCNHVTVVTNAWW